MYRNHTDGARGELIAAAWFLHRGWMVYRNVVGHGPADLAIARLRNSKPEFHLVEVRYVSATTRARPLSRIQKLLGVTMARVGSDGSVDWPLKRKDIDDEQTD